MGFLYQLAVVTEDSKWIADAFVKMADFVVVNIQQESGYFISVCRDTKQPSAYDATTVLILLFSPNMYFIYP